jgi:hypothetical protein
MQKKWDVDDAVIALCRDSESWSGSYYELSMAYASESLKREHYLRIMQYLWDDPSLLGVVRSPEQFGLQWETIEAPFLREGEHFYGCIRLSDGQIVGCGSLYIALEGMIWFTLYIPLAMLDQILPVHYPVTREENPWMTRIDKLLVTIGTRIYREHPFMLAVMGEEATGFPLKIILADIAQDPGLLVPETLFGQVGVAPYGERVAEGLWWTGGDRRKP